MSACFFGADARRLFGYHHPPRGAARRGVLLCQPWGPEYQYAHRALRVLAKRLAERGSHVLRFDYHGTGDSSGETTDVSLAGMLADAESGADELRRVCGTGTIDVIGLRLGAAVAAQYAARHTVRRLVLWDPVFDGARWIAEHPPARALAGAVNGSGHVEFAGQTVSSAFLDEVAGVTASSCEAVHAEAVLVVETQGVVNEPGARTTPLHWTTNHVPDAAAWVEDASIWSGQVPAKAIRTIVEWVTA